MGTMQCGLSGEETVCSCVCVYECVRILNIHADKSVCVCVCSSSEGFAGP